MSIRDKSIRMKCGHWETHRRPSRGHEGWKQQQRIQAMNCHECSMAEIAAEREANDGMLELSGSEKQIKWAKSIRQKVKAQIEALRDELVAERDIAPDESIPEDNYLRAVLDERRSARWIENRFKTINRNWLQNQIDGRA